MTTACQMVAAVELPAAVVQENICGPNLSLSTVDTSSPCEYCQVPEMPPVFITPVLLELFFVRGAKRHSKKRSKKKSSKEKRRCLSRIPENCL